LDELRRLSGDEEFYGTTLAAAAAKAKEDRHFVVVPCFSILLRDLFALNRSCCERYKFATWQNQDLLIESGLNLHLRSANSNLSKDRLNLSSSICFYKACKELKIIKMQ